MKNDYLQRLKYIFWDIVAAIFSYTALYYFRQTVIEKQRFADAAPSFGQTYFIALEFAISVYKSTAYLFSSL